MAPFNYADVKDHLSETEKNRFVACYFAIEDPNAAIDFKQAAKDFGSASVEAFKKAISTTFKKIEKMKESGDIDVPSAPQTPATKAKKATPTKSRKRKAADDDDAYEDKDGDYTPKKPSAKKARVAKVKSEAIVSEDEAELEPQLGSAPSEEALSQTPVKAEPALEPKSPEATQYEASLPEVPPVVTVAEQS